MFLVFNSVIELYHETSQMFCFDTSMKNSFVGFFFFLAVIQLVELYEGGW